MRICEKITEENHTTYGSASESSHSNNAESNKEPAD